jgi:hypothetical protein
VGGDCAAHDVPARQAAYGHMELAGIGRMV